MSNPNQKSYSVKVFESTLGILKKDWNPGEIDSYPYLPQISKYVWKNAWKGILKTRQVIIRTIKKTATQEPKPKKISAARKNIKWKKKM